jgi:hypothetical protein
MELSYFFLLYGIYPSWRLENMHKDGFSKAFFWSSLVSGIAGSFVRIF